MRRFPPSTAGNLTPPDLSSGAELCPSIVAASVHAYQDHIRVCEQHPVVGGLRKRSREHEPPFQALPEQVRIGTAQDSASWPADGYAYACYNGNFDGNPVALYPSYEAHGPGLEVHVRGGYTCPQGRKPLGKRA